MGPPSKQSEVFYPLMFPPKPTSVLPVPGNSEVTVFWVCDEIHDPKISGIYEITSIPPTVKFETDRTKCRMKKLENGTDYQFVVTAVNAVGENSSDPCQPVMPCECDPDDYQARLRKARNMTQTARIHYRDKRKAEDRARNKKRIKEKKDKAAAKRRRMSHARREDMAKKAKSRRKTIKAQKAKDSKAVKAEQRRLANLERERKAELRRRKLSQMHREDRADKVKKLTSLQKKKREKKQSKPKIVRSGANYDSKGVMGIGSAQKRDKKKVKSRTKRERKEIQKERAKRNRSGSAISLAASVSRKSVIQVEVKKKRGGQRGKRHQRNISALDFDARGKTFCFTGRMTAFGRSEAKRRVREAGGTVSSNVDESTDILVAGLGSGDKMQKAWTLKIPVWNEDKFLQAFGDTHKVDQED